jgi:hypothetical protein
LFINTLIVSSSLLFRYWTAERKAKQREVTIARMADSVVRAKISEHTLAAMADPAVKMRQRVAQAAAMARPDVREKISRRTKQAMTDPTKRKRAVDDLAATRSRPDHVEKIKAGTAKAWAADHEQTALRSAWKAARPDVRLEFLKTLGVPTIFAHAMSREADHG